MRSDWCPGVCANDRSLPHWPPFHTAEVESTGAHHQFYEKFNIRQQISIVFKHLWTIPSHHQVFLAQSRYAERGVVMHGSWQHG